MALNFVGKELTPSRGGNPLGAKLTGVRLTKLKKGQNQITFGEDVLAELGLSSIPVQASVVEGEGKMAGKLLIRFDGTGPFQLRYTSAKRKTTAHVMSSVLPLKGTGRAQYKVFADEKAIVIALPDEAAAAAPAAAPAPSPEPAAEPTPAASPDAAPAATTGGDLEL